MMKYLEEIIQLSAAERLLLLEELWNSIPTNEIVLRNSHKRELDRRLARMKSGGTKFFTWEQVKKNLHQNEG